MKTCKVIKGGESFQGKQGLDYFSGASAQSANSDGLCMHMLVMPPGAMAGFSQVRRANAMALLL